MNPKLGMHALEPLLGRTLVVVAHPDDECIACGGLLQRMREPAVAYATNGAPQDSYFWNKYGSREAYAQLREAEAAEALSKVGVSEVEFFARYARPVEEQANGLSGEFSDQELFLNLPRAAEVLEEIAQRRKVEALLTLAYEGGHPDHDSCSFLSSVVGARLGIPVWEAPLYHRLHGEGWFQRFVEEDGEVVEIEICGSELERKQQMITCYRSQFEALPSFRPELERFRRQARYDFCAPPHQGKLNYELWQWKMTGSEVAGSFASYLAHERSLSAGGEAGESLRIQD